MPLVSVMQRAEEESKQALQKRARNLTDVAWSRARE